MKAAAGRGNQRHRGALSFRPSVEPSRPASCWYTSPPGAIWAASVTLQDPFVWHNLHNQHSATRPARAGGPAPPETRNEDGQGHLVRLVRDEESLSLIHISEPTRLLS